MSFGEFSEKLHRDVGTEVYKNKIDKLFVIGKDAKFIANQAQKEGFNKENIFIFNDREKLVNSLKNNIKEGDLILFKASNGMKLFEIVEDLKVELEK